MGQEAPLKERMGNTKGTYWYRATYYICVLCGRENVDKERVYFKDEPKPKEFYKRHIYIEEACWSHF